MKNNNKLSKIISSNLTVLLVIGNLLLVNYLAQHFFYRWDLTENEDYSISSATKEALVSLDDIVTIKAYFSNDLPAQYANIRRDTSDILNEYRDYSKGKILLEFINPANDDTTRQSLYEQGIPQLEINDVKQDKLQVVKGYLGITISQGDNSQSLPVISSTLNLEYDLTSAINKVVASEPIRLGYLSSHGTTDMASAMRILQESLSEIYSISEIDLEKDKSIPTSIKSLLIVGPTQEFKEEELEAIDDFIVNGGSLIAMLDRYLVDNSLTATENTTNINDLLAKYGLTTRQGMILDTSNGQVTFNQGFISFQVNYPFWPKVKKEGFDSSNPAVSKLQSLILPWVSAVDLDMAKISSSTQVSYLAKTTSGAWEKTSNFVLYPQQVQDPSSKRGEFNLAIAISGDIKSAYSDKTSEQTRIIVIGDSNFAEDRTISANPDNLLFAMNLIDSTAMGDGLIGIRSKSVTSFPIEDISDTKRLAARYLNIFGLTVLVLTAGMIRYYLRKSAKTANKND